MGYRGETFAINLDRGGFDFNKNIDQIPPTAMIFGTKNINLHKGGRSKRGGTDNVNATAISGTPRIYGVYQFRLKDGTEAILTATDDGKIQKDYSTELITGLTIDRAVHFITFNNNCIICTGNDLPQVWDGSASSTYPLTGVVGTDISFTAGVKATQTFTFTGDPSDTETITINGKEMTFSTVPIDGTSEIEIQGGTATDMAAECVANLNDTARGGSNSEINVATYSNVAGVVTITHNTVGADGNSFTLAETASNLTVGGATLSGGVNATVSRTSADFVTRKFLANYKLKIKGSTSNDGDYTIETVIAGTLTLLDGDQLTTEGAGDTVTLTWGIPTDWSDGNYPRKMIKHGRGNSERLWAIYGKTNPFTVYASVNNPGDNSTESDFSDTNVLTFYIDTGDGIGIVNGVEYGDRLVCAGRSNVYIIDDTDTNTANWGYQEAQWKGGTATDRTFIAVTNDIISVTEDGTIYSVTAAQTFGDYKAAALTRTSFIDEFIRDELKLSAIDDFHMIFDPVLRAIYIFVVRSGQTNIDTALCYFIDRGQQEGWIIKDNIAQDSGFKASSSALIRKAVGDYKIYTGGWDDGFVWELETINKNDNGNSYASGFKTPRINVGDPRLTKRFDIGRLLAETTGNYKLAISIWVDGINVGGQISVSILGQSSIYNGTSTYGTDTSQGVYFKPEIIEIPFPIGKIGKRIEFQINNNNANEDFFVSLLLIDFKPLSKLPASSLAEKGATTAIA